MIRLHSANLGIGLASLASIAFVGIVIAACSSAEPEAAAAPNPNGKVEGAECTDGSECASLTCAKGKCTPVTGANPTNKTKDGDETDVDCGGKSSPPCADGKTCTVGTDCVSGTCTANVCKAPTATDGVKNGDESDVDCGGTTTKAPKCANDKGCAKNEDCTSGSCSYAKKCVEFPSCVGHFGGDTCGAGETGAPDAKHESCCATAKLSGGTRVGKYEITAGRMRAFVERFNGDLQSWAATNPKGWNQGWNDQLPASMDDARNALGPGGKCGCNVGPQSLGGRTYWQQDPFDNAEDHSDFSKDAMDEKSLNCIQWHMVQALCAFDGGRLVSAAEVQELITNAGAGQWPWSFQDSSGYNVNSQDERVSHKYSYATPNPPANMRMQGGGPLDRAFWIAPPGRHPKGYNKIGAADAVGNVMDWVNNGERQLVQTVSWEDHGLSNNIATWKGGACGNNSPDGYYATGGRCAFP
jgi:hypothetical protein